MTQKRADKDLCFLCRALDGALKSFAADEVCWEGSALLEAKALFMARRERGVVVSYSGTSRHMKRSALDASHLLGKADMSPPQQEAREILHQMQRVLPEAGVSIQQEPNANCDIASWPPSCNYLHMIESDKGCLDILGHLDPVLRILMDAYQHEGEHIHDSADNMSTSGVRVYRESSMTLTVQGTELRTLCEVNNPEFYGLLAREDNEACVEHDSDNSLTTS